LLIRHFEEGLNSYTYLEMEPDESEGSVIEGFRKIGKMQGYSHSQQDVLE